jgi:Bacterial Ig-like domain
MTWRKRRWSVLLLAVALVAARCTGVGQNCTTDADCNSESVCDPTLKVCFFYSGPVVTSIIPVDQATGVIAAGGQVVATFSTAVVDAGVNASSFKVVGQGFNTFGNYLVVDAGVTQATFEPLAGGLALGTDYRVSLTSSINDLQGDPLLPFTSTFSTADGEFGAGGTLRFSSQTGAYTMAGNYYGNILTAVDVYTGGGTSFDYELMVGVSDAGSSPVVTTVIQNVVGQETNNLSAAIASDQAALVAWTTQPTDAGTPLTYTALVSVYDPASHTWGANTALTGPEPVPQFPQVVAFKTASGDNGFAVWLQDGGVPGKLAVYGNYHKAGAGWVGATSFQTNPTLAASNISVAADFNGNVLVAWQSEQTGGGPSEILAVYSAIGGSPGSPVVVSNPSMASVVPQVALGITGLGAIVWPQQTYLPDAGLSASHVFAATFDPSLVPSVGTAVQLDSAATFADFPQVGVAADGNVFVIWQELGAVVTSTFSHGADGGGWSTPVVLDSDPTYVVNGPAVAVDPGGNAVAEWLKLTPDAGYQMFGSRYTADAGWHGKTQLAIGADPVLDIVPTLAVDAMGRSFSLDTRLPGDTLYLEYIPFK